MNKAEIERLLEKKIRKMMVPALTVAVCYFLEVGIIFWVDVRLGIAFILGAVNGIMCFSMRVQVADALHLFYFWRNPDKWPTQPEPPSGSVAPSDDQGGQP